MSPSGLLKKKKQNICTFIPKNLSFKQSLIKRCLDIIKMFVRDKSFVEKQLINL